MRGGIDLEHHAEGFFTFSTFSVPGATAFTLWGYSFFAQEGAESLSPDVNVVTTV